MHFLLILIGFLIVLITGWDLFLTMVLPGTIIGSARLTRSYYRATIPLLVGIVRHVKSPQLRNSLHAIYGPLSLLFLIVVWISGLILGYSFIHWGINLMYYPTHDHTNFKDQLFYSGATFFTLGFGDFTSPGGWDRLASIVEAGTGLGILAIIVSYLPVLYAGFSQREAGVTLFSTRAGSPPSSAAMLHRYTQHKDRSLLLKALQEQEIWCSRLLEVHTSYPMLASYRSQNPQHSWLGTLCLVLDTCAVLQVGYTDQPEWETTILDQAEITFTMGSRAVIVMCGTLGLTPALAIEERYQESDFLHLAKLLQNDKLFLNTSADARVRFASLRTLYEPYIEALAKRLMLELPIFLPTAEEYRPTTPESAAEQAREDVMLESSESLNAN